MSKIIAPSLPAELLHFLHEHEELLPDPASYGKATKTVYDALKHRRWEANTQRNHALRELTCNFVDTVVAPLLWENGKGNHDETFYQVGRCAPQAETYLFSTACTHARVVVVVVVVCLW